MEKPASPIQNIAYDNARQPSLAIEVMRLSELFGRVDALHFLPPQRPQFHLLSFVTEGRGHHLIDFCIHRCRRGTILHVRPGQIQQFFRDQTFEAIVVLFSPLFILPDNALEELSGYENVADLVLPGGSLDTGGETCDLAQDDFERLLAEYGRADGTPLAGRLLQHLLNVTLLRLAAMSVALSPRVDPFSAASRIVARFQRALEQRFCQKHGVGDYASHLGCSPKTLHASCTRMRGVGPKTMIEQRLILEAQRMLVHTPLTVDRIGSELGFPEPANFARMFKRVTGISPGHFRASRGRQESRSRAKTSNTQSART